MGKLPSLPQEIIEDIVYRLPAKAVGRWRCVSKAWLALLTQPHFIKTHLKLTRKNPTHLLSLISKHDGALFSVPTDSLFNETPSCWAAELKFPYKVVEKWRNNVSASCDRLILVSSKDFSYSNADRKVWLMNPATGVIRSVSPSPFAHGGSGAAYNFYGLGYDEVRDDFKLISINMKEFVTSDSGTLFSVFSVKSGAWRWVNISPYTLTIPFLTSAVFVDGCIHWLAYDAWKCCCIIIAFSLSNEKVYEVPLPKFDGSKYQFYRLKLFGGCLCLVPKKIDNKGIGVWVMNEYGIQESWTRFTIVDPEEEKFRPLCQLGEEQVVLVKNETTADEKLVRYDFKNETVKDIVVNGIPGDFRIGVTYTESLVSPYG